MGNKFTLKILKWQIPGVKLMIPDLQRGRKLNLLMCSKLTHKTESALSHPDESQLPDYVHSN